MVLFEDLINKASEFYYLKQQLDLLLGACAARIKQLISMIKQTDIKNSDVIFEELFKIQRILSTMKYKYLFEFDSFLDNFIYFFDRQDDYNKLYLFNHFKCNLDFPE